MPPTNHALIAATFKAPTLTLGLAPYSSPSAGELVIKTHAVALNPADWGVQRFGVIVPEAEYPCILGCDVAGEVVELPKPTDKDDKDGGKDDWIQSFKIDDRVIGQTGPMLTKPSTDFDLSPPELSAWKDKKIYSYGAFQSYVVLKGPLISKVPDHINFEDAVVLPLGITTAASCLFPKTMLNLDMPPLSGKAPMKNKILLVWGASSSVGSCGVQLATLAGYDVIGICSARNHDMVMSLGSVKCFDHNSPTIIDDVTAFIADKEVVGAYDAISTQPTLTPLISILAKAPIARGFIAAIYPGADANSTPEVEIIVNLTQGMDQFYDTAGKIRGWLDAALLDGRIKCMPEKEVLGKGFEHVQEGLDRLAEMKVSGRKLVVTL